MTHRGCGVFGAPALGAPARASTPAALASLTADGTHPLVGLYGQERDRAVRAAREALGFGLEERRVRIDEATRERLAQVLLAALRDPELGLSAEQLEAAPEVAARLIRSGAIP